MTSAGFPTSSTLSKNPRPETRAPRPRARGAGGGWVRGFAGVLLAGDQDTTFDTVRGLDHGAWVPARLAWPAAKLPVLEVSMPFLDPPQLFQLGRALRPLRDDGVLVVGSGGIVHNLSRVRYADKDAPVDEWAAEFDAWVALQVEKREIGKLYEYRRSA